MVEAANAGKSSFLNRLTLRKRRGVGRVLSEDRVQAPLSRRSMSVVLVVLLETKTWYMIYIHVLHFLNII